MLHPELQKKYRNTCNLMTITAMEQVANNLTAQGLIEDSHYIRDLIAERKAYRAEISPVQRERRPTPAQTAPAEPILSPAATHALKQWAVIAFVGSSLALTVAFFVIPLLKAAGAACSAFLEAYGAIVIASIIGLSVLWYLVVGLFSKKNEYPQSSPSGHTYITNIFVGENGGVEVKQ